MALTARSHVIYLMGNYGKPLNNTRDESSGASAKISPVDGFPRKKWIPFITYAGLPRKKWIPPYVISVVHSYIVNW